MRPRKFEQAERRYGSAPQPPAPAPPRPAFAAEDQGLLFELPDTQVRLTNDKAGRESLADAVGTILLAKGFTIAVTAEKRDLSLGAFGGGCDVAFLSKLESALRSHLQAVGFKRLRCAAEGHTVNVRK